MTDRAALEAASAAGVIDAAQVGPLYDFLNAHAAKPLVAGEEDLRFIRNFHDVFLAIGILLFAIGMGVAIGATVAGVKAMGPGPAAILTGAMSCGAAVVMWLLGEFFARRRRLFLPAIAIVCAFTVFCVVGAGSLYFGTLLGSGMSQTTGDTMPMEARLGFVLAASLAVIAPLAFYARFRLPFSLGLAGGGFALLAMAVCASADWQITLKYLPALYLGLGVLLFLAAVAFDMRDPARQTRLSDNGFWLHFAAAPLILNGVFGLIGMGLSNGAAASPNVAMITGGAAGNVQALATLGAIVVLGVISLLINRRALIVSALLTAGVAIGVLLNSTGLGVGALAAATLIALGSFVLILGAGWHAARRALLGWVKPEGFWARVFPPEGAPL
jgi:hypothetical protein